MIRKVGLVFGIMTFTLASVVGLSGCTSERNQDPDNTVYLALGARVDSLDPVFADDAYSNPAVAKVYETLYQYHYLKRPLELEPLLAAKLPQWNSKKDELTIHLKKGVLFQDDAAFKKTKGKGRERKGTGACRSVDGGRSKGANGRKQRRR